HPGWLRVHGRVRRRTAVPRCQADRARRRDDRDPGAHSRPLAGTELRDLGGLPIWNTEEGSAVKGLGGKVVLVTGAARGIRRAIATRFVEEGAKVAIADIDGENAAKTASELGRGTVGIRVDVTDSSAIRAAVADAAAKLGPIDVLVNNAGWDKVEPF